MYNPHRQFIVFPKLSGLRLRGSVVAAPDRDTAKKIYTARGIEVTAVFAEWEFNVCLTVGAAVGCIAVLLAFANFAPRLFA